MNKKVVVITGGGGQSARLLAEYLSDVAGYEIHMDGGEPLACVSKHYHLDLSTKESNEVLAMQRPDYWFNFAALSSPKESCDKVEECFNINLGGVLHQLEAIKNYAPLCRYFNAGSVLETDGYVSKYDPKTPYAISKLAAHQLINFYRQQYGLYAVQGILGLHESKLRQGDFLFKNIVNHAKNIVSAIENKEKFLPIQVYNPNALINISLAKDVVEVIWESVQWDDPEDFVVQNSCPIYLREFIQQTFESLGIECYWAKDNLIVPDYFWNSVEMKSGILATAVEKKRYEFSGLQIPRNTYWTNSTVEDIIKELV